MTELSSTDEAAGADSPESFRRPADSVPARPPLPAAPGTDNGPATSAMAAVSPDVRSEQPAARAYLPGSSYSQSARALPAEDVTGFIPPAAVPLPGARPVPGDLPLPPIGAAPPGSSRRGYPKPDRKPVVVRGPRRAKLVLRRVDPWSVLKFSFLFSVCLLIVWVVSIGALFDLLRTMHVFDNINSVLASATSDPSSNGIHINPTSHEVTLWAAILGAVNALLFTALATLGAFLYNVISMLVGGIEVTLAERD